MMCEPCGGEGQAGERKTMKVKSPRDPTKEEKEEHEKTHLPFRDWCRHCVAGRGKEAPCRTSKGTISGSEVHIDVMFMGEERE